MLVQCERWACKESLREPRRGDTYPLFFCELGDKMKLTAEDDGERERVDMDGGGDPRGLQPARLEMFLPLAHALVVVS